MNRSRIYFLMLAIATIALGLFSRSAAIRPFIFNEVGDALYATMVYFLWGVLWPKASMQKIFLLTIIFCFAVEFSQMIDTEWINGIRETRMGKLILGQGFLWIDLLAYFFGGILAVILQKMVFKQIKE